MNRENRKVNRKSRKEKENISENMNRKDSQ